MQLETKTVTKFAPLAVEPELKVTPLTEELEEPDVNVLIIFNEALPDTEPAIKKDARSREFKSTVRNLCFSKVLSNASKLSMDNENTIILDSTLGGKPNPKLNVDHFELEAKAFGYCIEYMNHFKTLPEKPDGEHFRFYASKPLFSSELKYLYNEWTANWLANIQVESDKFARTLNLGTAPNGRPIGFNILPAFILNVADRIDSHELIHVFASFYAIHIRGVKDIEMRKTLLANGVGRKQLRQD